MGRFLFAGRAICLRFGGEGLEERARRHRGKRQSDVGAFALNGMYRIPWREAATFERVRTCQVAVSVMGETVMAKRAISDGTLFIHGSRHLFAVRR